MLTHTVVYTSRGREYSTRIESETRLTNNECELRVRESHPEAVVTRVEVASVDLTGL
jgi:hypothetical protein